MASQTDNFAKCAQKMHVWPLFLSNKLLFFLELCAEEVSSLDGKQQKVDAKEENDLRKRL